MRLLTTLIILLGGAAWLAAQEADTLSPRILRQWTLSGDYSREITIPLDTSFSLSHQFRLSDKYSPFNAYTGNYGLPLYQISFFDRITDPDKFLYRSYYPFMHLADKPVFMNTQVPYTQMDYASAGPRQLSEQVFRIRHSQNANRFLNFGIIFDVIYSLGQYNYQRADNKNFNFYSSYSGDKYKFYISGAVNDHSSLENGGIVDDTQLESFQTRDIQVKLGSLSNAKSVLKNRNLLVIQKYTVGGRQATKSDTAANTETKKSLNLNGTFSHIFTWDKTRKSYEDNYPLSGLYDTCYISEQLTFDSLSQRVLKNTLRFDFGTDESRKFSLGGGVGIRNELWRYGQVIPSAASSPSDTVKWNESNNVLVGRLYNSIGTKFRWVATGEMYITGYRAGDFDVKGTITKEFEFKSGAARWDIDGRMSNITPSFWMNTYGSNHFKWENNLLNEFRIDAGTVFIYPEGKLTARFNYAITDNFTFFNPAGIPVQHEGGLSVISGFVKKELSAWKFHLASEILLQQSSNRDILDLPLLTIRSAGFFEHNLKFRLTGGNINIQIGGEIFYHTGYTGLSYIPSTGVYYQKNGTTTGNYPFLNAFFNVKIKRTRFFFVFDHVNSGLTGYNYYLVPSYPMNIRMFRYGLSWTFYD